MYNSVRLLPTLRGSFNPNGRITASKILHTKRSSSLTGRSPHIMRRAIMLSISVCKTRGKDTNVRRKLRIVQSSNSYRRFAATRR